LQRMPLPIATLDIPPLETDAASKEVKKSQTSVQTH